MRDTLFGAIGGLALFLFGMGMHSDGLKKAAGDRLRRLLRMVTRWPLLAYLVGAGVTCLIQSSSATTVIVVGLINAGLLTLKQAICVILGANVGTTMTSWLVAVTSSFKVDLYALPAVAIGVALHVFGKRQSVKYLGQILIGFGILFIGIGFMKGAFGPLKESEAAKRVFVRVGDYPILAVLVGACFTMLVQSSSASITMVTALAAGGGFGGDFHPALTAIVPLILGDNIGTTITAQIAAMRTNPSGRRTAMAHTLFNVIGVLIVLPFIYNGWFIRLVENLTPAEHTIEKIWYFAAVSHTMFNVSASLIMLPMAGLLERLVKRIIPVRESELAMRPVTLEAHLLNTPGVAMDQTQKEIARMAHTAKDALDDALTGLRQDDRRALGRVQDKEDTVDSFQTAITRYLVALSQRTLSSEMANELPVLMHSVNDLERIADHAVNISQIGRRKIDQRESFSPAAESELGAMQDELEGMFACVLAGVEGGGASAVRPVLEHEKVLNRMQMDLRKTHVERLGKQECSPIAGLIFVDCVDNMEKIGDHLTNIAQGILAGLQWSDAHHKKGPDDD